MHRAVLQACLPWFLWLCVACGLALLLVQFCGGRCDWRRLRRLATSEEGAVQSLSLVLTLPVFILLILFIVQITQVMVGIMLVNYAAFAAGRAASVWIPAEVTPNSTFTDDLSRVDPINDQLKSDWERANVLLGSVSEDPLRPGSWRLMPGSEMNSPKYQKVLLAAIIPCLTISPSKSLGTGQQLAPWLQSTQSAILKLYSQVDPKSKSNQVLPQRLRNKLAYSSQFTTVILQWQNVAHPNLDIQLDLGGVTHNPLAHPDPRVPPWNKNEVGYRDPVTVFVTHKFALLPGIGRILAKATNPTNSSLPAAAGADRVAGSITRQGGSKGNELNTIDLTASATFVNEGFKSVLRHAIQP